MDSQAFGHRLKVLMADRGFTTSSLAQAVGVSRQMVNNYVNNNAIPSLKVACDIAGALGVSVDDLATTPLSELVS